MSETRTVRIGDRAIGASAEPFVIAEAGINHNGDLRQALTMISAAKAAGADAVKFQTFKAEEFILDPALPFTYTSRGREVTESMLAMFRRHEFKEEEWRKIREFCRETGIRFLSTPQNPSDLTLLLHLGVDAVKVGSDDFNNLPLLRHYAKAGLPLILSCGMADLAEVATGLEAAGAFSGGDVILLLCTSQYPTPPSDVHIAKLRTLAAAFPDIPLGFSDHTQGPTAAQLAVALGACVFEKHFTLDHDLEGPDHWFSEDPDGLKTWVESIRTARVMLGSPVIRPTSAEREMRVLARRSVVALQDIGEGGEFSAANTGLRRPGDGLPPAFLDEVLGRRATRAIGRGQQIRLGDFR